ncbi:hypothetical protein [Phormidium sp. CCY1219]|nr:hypothetical protein [Phormidium sp. CCY1219]MEB3827191.1 hypothetical protein [Phormidium sp. CCY1219]
MFVFAGVTTHSPANSFGDSPSTPLEKTIHAIAPRARLWVYRFDCAE